MSSDIGVLQLSIKDNSKDAGKGVDQLADALTRVKDVVDSGLGLSAVNDHLKTFAQTINRQKNTQKVIKDLTAFGNAIDKLSKVQKAINFNTEPIKELKAAIGDGIKITGNPAGQIERIKNSLSGKWGTSAITTMKNLKTAVDEFQKSNTAQTLNDVAKALNNYVKAANSTQTVKGIAAEAKKEIDKSGWATETGRYKLNLGQFGEKKPSDKTDSKVAQGLENIVDIVKSKRSEIDDEFKALSSSIQKSTNTDIDLKQMVSSPVEALSRVHQDMADTTALLGMAVGVVTPKIQQMSSEEMILAGNARAAATAIAQLIERLNTPIKEVKFSNIVNLATGVVGNQMKSAEESANSFTSALQKLEEVDFSQIAPVTGRTEDFKSAQEEISYYTEMVRINEKALETATSTLDEFKRKAAESGDSTKYAESIKYAEQAVENAKSRLENFRIALSMIREDIIAVVSEMTGIPKATVAANINFEKIAKTISEIPSVARKAVASTLSEFKKMEKAGTFESWMYGPRTAPFADTRGFQSGYQTEAERMQKNPQWYLPEDFYQKINDVMSEVQTQANETSSAMQSVASATTGAMQQVSSSVTNTTNNVAGAAANMSGSVANGAGAVSNGMNTIATTTSVASKYLNQLNGTLSSVTASMSSTSTNTSYVTSYMSSAPGVFDRFSAAAKSLWATIQGLDTGFKGLKSSIKSMFPTLSNLSKRFVGMMKMRALRYIVRQLASGVREGIENLYHYSELVGTSFASGMDEAATAIQQMKNSIGAALAPVIQALIPILNSAISGFINLINYVNQFFALINGQTTWTRALPEPAEAFEKSSKAAKGASKAMKDLLADWDELNIIQSEHTSGGSSSGKSSAEYKNMFEEVNTFDDAVKNVLKYINDYLGGIPDIIRKAGLLLLGWKFSRAFTGLLGKLGKIIAGAALITIGVDFAYGAGFEAGKKGYFDKADILTAIGGTLASAIGGSLIGLSVAGPGGAVVGALVGMTIGITATLLGWINGRKDAADAVKWGNLHYTREQVENYVKNQFKFDITAEVKAIHANVEFLEDARNEADAAITQFESDLKTAKVNVAIGANASENSDSMKVALGSAQSAIRSLQNLIDKTETGVEVGLKYLPYKDENGNDISADILANIKVADQPIRDYLTKMGEELADAMLEGEKAGWKNGTDKAALELMTAQQEIFTKAQQYARDMQLNASVGVEGNKVVKDGLIDRDTALETMEYQKEQLEKYTDEALAETKAEAANWYYLAGVARAAAEEEAKKGHVESASDLESSANELEKRALDTIEEARKRIDDKLKESKEIINQDWAAIFKSVYGLDIDKAIGEGTSPLIDWLFWQVDSGFAENLKSAENKGNFIAEWVKSTLLQDIDHNGIIADAVNTWGLNLWDVLTSGAKKNLFMNVADILNGDYEEATKAIMAAFGINFEDVAPYIEEYSHYVKKEILNAEQQNQNSNFLGDIIDYLGLSYKDPLDIPVNVEVEAENLEELKKEITDAMSDSFMSSEEQNRLIVKYGVQNYKEMLKELQYNLDEEGYNIGKTRTPYRVSASAGASSVGWGSSTPYVNTPKDDTLTEEKITNGVSSGVRKANEDQNSLIRELITLTTRIANKEWVINVKPNSNWGAHNAKSQIAYDKVTG